MADKVCPICKSPAERLDPTGDHDAFDCPRHGVFTVADTALVSKASATEAQWEAALERAKQWAAPDERPKITTYLF